MKNKNFWETGFTEENVKVICQLKFSLDSKYLYLCINI